MTGSMQRFDSSPWSLSRNKLHTSNCNRDTTGTGAESAQINLQPAPPAVTLKVRHVIYIFIDASLGFSCYFYVALHVKLCVSFYLFIFFMIVDMCSLLNDVDLRLWTEETDG